MQAQQPRDEDIVRKLTSVLMLVGGLAFMALAVLMILPVGVNLPESWFGALLIILFAGGGVWLVYKAARRLIRATDP